MEKTNKTKKKKKKMKKKAFHSRIWIWGTCKLDALYHLHIDFYERVCPSFLVISCCANMKHNIFLPYDLCHMQYTGLFKDIIRFMQEPFRFPFKILVNKSTAGKVISRLLEKRVFLEPWCFLNPLVYTLSTPKFTAVVQPAGSS